MNITDAKLLKLCVDQRPLRLSGHVCAQTPSDPLLMGHKNDGKRDSSRGPGSLRVLCAEQLVDELVLESPVALFKCGVRFAGCAMAWVGWLRVCAAV